VDPRIIIGGILAVGFIGGAGLGFYGVSQTDFQFSALAPGFSTTDCEWVDHPKGDGFTSKESFFDAYEANTNGTREQIQEFADFRVRDGGIEYRTCEVES
jgi:hypothetical protein